ncbi:hypothetical protein JZ751_022259 [Albula glossodonta]|uniref:SEFIR domain-containing protein n=1 Tax=Albula glossodonta TaxID=121402 RepID=A0A8T2NIV2_9TELE|nr:hypothetical protein JZ751_022259 [Albula glossodonta]
MSSDIGLATPELYSRDNCLDKGWLEHKLYTPTAPQDLTVDLDVRRDEKGDLVPVIVVRWSVPTDGSLWKPNIALERSTGQDGKPEVTVSFNTSELSEKYSVVLQCSLDRMTQPIMKIQPFFTLCQNDCTRHVYETNICSHPSFLLKDSKEDTANTPKKLLIIYSLDHPLYKDIVLKLCAFLRAKCGIEVVLDLLDGAWLGTVGRMQWLDWQKQQIEKSSDKILILCSRGVRAKWKAMTGEGRVILREDTHSPTGDMLTPALSLIIPDMLHAAAFEKYMVAYFEDVSCEDDVPAPFNITIKYKLMKHFEELYFRILGKEKHEPGRVNRIEGIAQDEYFNCPSGRALRDAIETLQAYQLENPDWFEKECVESEDEVAESDSQDPLLADTCNPIFQFVPECKEGPPVLVNEVETNEDSRCTQALMPLLNYGGESVSTSELYPHVHPGHSRVYSSHPVVLDTSDNLDSGTYLSIFEGQQAMNAELDQPDPSTQERLCQLEEFPSERYPVEDEEEAHTSFGPPSQETLQRLLALQQSLGPMAVPSPECVEDEYAFETEVPQRWMVEAGSSKRPQSGSDQGYISRSSIHHDSTFGDDSQNPLNTLSRLQEACLLNSLNPYRS